MRKLVVNGLYIVVYLPYNNMSYNKMFDAQVITLVLLQNVSVQLLNKLKLFVVC